MARKPTIIVTGCSSGIGAYCANRLRTEGWSVIASARKPADIDRLRSEGYPTFFLDYRDDASIRAFFDAALDVTDGRLDALFNNGAYAQAGAVEDLPVDALREQFEANVFGWHQLTRLVVPVMRAQGAGRIIQTSSVLGLVPMPMRGAYCASKYALEALSLCMREELRDDNIHVSLIEPGPVPSRIATNALAYVEKYIDVAGSAHAERYEKRLAELRAGGTPDDPKNRALEGCYRALRHALTSKRPRHRYPVTPQTRIVAAALRVLPHDFFHRSLARRS